MKNEQNEIRKKLEPVRPVHGNWQEPPSSWKLDRRSTYSSYASGGKHGPSNEMIKYIEKANDLCDIFLFYWPISLLQKIVKYTNQYCYEDWVVEEERMNRDGIVGKKKYFKACKKNDMGSRHRGDSSTIKYPITIGYIMVFIGTVILNGCVGSCKQPFRLYYEQAPHGISYPPIRNSVSRDAFEFLRSHIHFCDNSRAYTKTHRNYDPL